MVSVRFSEVRDSLTVDCSAAQALTIAEIRGGAAASKSVEF